MKCEEVVPANLTRADLHAAAERNKQWGRWGPDDEIGTLNHVTPERVAAAARLVRTGRTFSLAMDLDRHGPQRQKPGGGGRRFNPIHTMLVSGADCCSAMDPSRTIFCADDMISMPLQCATQWDSLAHVFYYDKMWNGYDARLVDGAGAKKCGIEKTRTRMMGRGVLLDIPRHLGLDWLPDNYAITVAELEACAAAQKVVVGPGDFLLVRTGSMERWEGQPYWGDFLGAVTPGLDFETLDWLREREVAAVACDNYAVEALPSRMAGTSVPFHWIAIPMIGLTLGEMFRLKELAADCADDGVYEFMFCAPPLPVTGAVGTPINPIAIK
jgi:kynurenine formamidase